uniref:Supervillin c n=1 Tax=Fundulus heteroclitus TaxID=8078 RepID=A0A3Q2PCL5_FUNHE
MDATEKQALEPRAERIARYKAERRRELAELYGDLEELPSKWVRRDGKKVNNPATPARGGALNSDGRGEGVNGRTREVTNGVEADPPTEPSYLRSQSYQDSATVLVEDAPQLHTRVSVGQLKSVLLQQAESGAGQEKLGPDIGQTTSSLDLAAGSEGSRRRTRRYLPGASGGGRKTSERFRTQPITANEMEERTGLLDAEVNDNKKADVKTDDRAKMSVAAKMSLFKELEKSAAPDSSALLKPRSASSFQERRTRRGNEHRFLTQPITCEEMVAISAPPAEEVQTEQAEPVEAADESCRMSMREKLALFNRVSLHGKNGAGPTDGPPERRKQKGARYRTQPITVDEVSLLQKGPIQLPAFSLSPNLHDRQQASPVNLKPSEVRLIQPISELSEPESTHRGSRDCNSVPPSKGILKKSCPEGSEWSGTGGREPLPNHQQNGRDVTDAEMFGRTEGAERLESQRETPGVQRSSVRAAPWRQRARNRRETPTPASSERDAPQEERPSRSGPQQEIASSVGNGSDVTRTQDEEQSDKPKQNVLVCGGVRSPKQQEAAASVRGTEPSESPPLETPQCWEPIFASVYSISTPQYIMCFNQTSLCFEAQEVSSPTKSAVQPQWRQKAKEAEDELQMEEAEERTVQQQSSAQEAAISVKRSPGSPAEPDSRDVSKKKMDSSEATTESVSHMNPAHEEAPVDSSKMSDGGFCGGCLPPPAGGPTPCGDVAASERERDFATLCQSSMPILSSAVAEHRRAVRPSRRTQGSRNPLRALAAREDIRQDYMGDRDNTAAEERGQAEKNCKNSSPPESLPITSSDKETTRTFPPFSNLMLIHVKGRRQVQVRLVEPSVRSLNSGDCFLLVAPEHCILWSGEFANKEERAKALELAAFIQGHRDLGCQAPQVLHLEEGLNSDGADAADFWSLLGGRQRYRGAGAPEEDALFEQGVVESNCVYSLVEDRLVPHERAWASVPSTSLLGSSEVLVFDFGSEVYLWHGRDVSPGRKDVALQLTQQVWAGEYDYGNCRVNPLDPTQSNPSVQPRGEGRPRWALLAVVSEDSETALFREKFQGPTRGSGDTVEVTSGREEMQSVLAEPPQPQSSSSDGLSPCDVKALASGGLLEEGVSVRTILAGVDVRRGCGVITLEEGHQMELRTVSVDTWHVQEFDDSEIPVESTGQLHEGDSYVIRWTYSISAVDNQDECGNASKSKENTAFFLWRGRHSSVSGEDTAAFLSIGMNEQEDSQVVVPQGAEPPCFLQLFQGGLVIHKGKREEATSTAADWRLFCVRGELPEEALLLEGECCCSSLRSRGSVVLLNSQQGALYLWTGCKAHSGAREVSKRAVERLTEMSPLELGLCKNNPVKVHFVEEGSEPADFWTALGQMNRKAYDCMLQDPGKYNFTPRLFHLSASSGKFKAEELQSLIRLPGVVMAMPFVQESLYTVPQPAMFLLDNRLEVYLWQRGQPEQTESSASAWSLWHNERKCAMQTALQYCKEINPRRPPQAYLILEGSEPLTFTNVFPRWERNLGPTTQACTHSYIISISCQKVG